MTLVVGLEHTPKHQNTLPDLLHKTERERNAGELCFPFPLSTTAEMSREYKVCAVIHSPPPPRSFLLSNQNFHAERHRLVSRIRSHLSLFFLSRLTFPLLSPFLLRKSPSLRSLGLLLEAVVRPFACSAGFWSLHPWQQRRLRGLEVDILLDLLNLPGLLQLLVDSQVISVQLICFMGYG